MKRYISKIWFKDPVMGCYEIIDKEIGSSFLVCDDKKTIDTIVELLNKQDEKIKELEEDIMAKDILINTYMSIVGTLDNAKQSQNQKAIEVLGRLREELCQPYSDDVFSAGKIAEQIDELIAELRGKENE